MIAFGLVKRSGPTDAGWDVYRWDGEHARNLTEEAGAGDYLRSREAAIQWGRTWAWKAGETWRLDSDLDTRLLRYRALLDGIVEAAKREDHKAVAQVCIVAAGVAFREDAQQLLQVAEYALRCWREQLERPAHPQLLLVDGGKGGGVQ